MLAAFSALELSMSKPRTDGPTCIPMLRTKNCFRPGNGGMEEKDEFNILNEMHRLGKGFQTGRFRVVIVTVVMVVV